MAPVRLISHPSKRTHDNLVRDLWRPAFLFSSMLVLTACETTSTKPTSIQDQPTGTNNEPALVINIDLTEPHVAEDKAVAKESTASTDEPIIITIEEPVSVDSSPQPEGEPTAAVADITESQPEPETDTTTELSASQTQAQREAAHQQLVARQLQLLSLADNMYSKGYYDLSLSLLNDIIMDALDKPDLGRYLELMAASHLRAGDSYSALAWLHQAQAQAPAADKASYLRRLQLLQQAYTANEQHLEAAISAIEISISQAEASSAEQLQISNDHIWDLLLQVPSMQLHAKLKSPLHPLAKGWLELALSTDNLHTLEQQQAAIINWQLNNPLHPASQTPPTSLSKLADLQANQAQKLALVLPTSGPLGKLGQAIIDGFMASYYQTYQQCSSACRSLPQLMFVDSQKITNWMATYEQLQQQGVELVIGPLNKDKVTELEQLNLPIPTLALNYITEDQPAKHSESDAISDAIIQYVAPANGQEELESQPQTDGLEVGQALYQFGLSLEEEARQLAQHGRQTGYKNALIIHANTPWAERANQAFQQQWQLLGGKISDAISFNGDGDHAQSISAGLHINSSKQRRKAMQKLLGQNLKFEPRRRQDVDLVVMLALPQDARQLVPTLAFHHAADIPVFASHHTYQGPTESTRDRDLNKVYFSDLPWMLEADETANKVQSVWPNRQRYNRLFALGADAFRLFPRLEQMQMFPATRVKGLTGLLRLEDYAVMAKLTWAQFSNGQPQVQQGAHEID